MSFGNRETEAIYNFAQGFESTNTARAFVTGYNQGDSANDYMNAFLDFRSAGMAGRDFDSVLQSTARRIFYARNVLNGVKIRTEYKADRL